MKARPDRPGARHQPVHQERGADHVAGRFEDQDEQEQDQDLRQEHDHRADPGDHAVDDQRAKQAVGQARSPTWLPSAPIAASIQPTGASLPGEHRLEHDEQDRGEDQRAGDRVEQRPRRAGASAADRRFADDRADVAMARARRWSVSEVVARRRRRRGPRRGPISSSPSWPRARRARGLRTATVAITGTPSSALKPGAIELEPVALGEVDHVERDHHRQAERRSAAARSAGDCRGWRRRRTISSASGSRSPSCLPSSTSRVTASSGLVGSRL